MAILFPFIIIFTVLFIQMVFSREAQSEGKKAEIIGKNNKFIFTYQWLLELRIRTESEITDECAKKSSMQTWMQII